MPSRALTSEQEQDAKRLKRLFDNWRKDQLDPSGKLIPIEALAARAHHKQSAFSQRLNGQMALNAKAASQFATLIGCKVLDFSPHLAAEIAALSQNNGPAKPAPTSKLGDTSWTKDLSPTQAKLDMLVHDNIKKLDDATTTALITLIEAALRGRVQAKAKKKKVKA